MQKDRTLPLGDLSATDFLKNYWQKKPLFIPNAFPDYHSPLSADELAGLACEAEVESRIVLENGEDGPWTVRHGPFAEDTFSTLPESHWTLLVQGCNRLVPEVAELLEHFRFIPNWRVDDIMISYAANQGSVGPHVDQYDVFLIQGVGTRRWQISAQKPTDDDLLPNLPLRIMKDFQATQEWIVKPGDMLYLPPGVPHYGVALDDCITLSVGFRAPSHRELLIGFLDHLLEQTPSRYSEPRYEDADLQLQDHNGEISAATLKKITQILQQPGNNKALIETWFGSYITRGQGEDTDERPDSITIKEITALLNENETIYRSEFSRFAFIDKQTEGCQVFVDGESYLFPPQLKAAINILCDHQIIPSASIIDALDNKPFARFITQLINEDKLYFE